MTTDAHLVPLPGSSRSDPVGIEHIEPVPADEVIQFTIVLRRKADIPAELVEGPSTVTTQELADSYGANTDDLAAVRTALTAAGAQILEEHAGSRRLAVSAPHSAITELFGVELNRVRSTHPSSRGPVVHRARTGELRVPATLDGLVTAVLGLDNRPQARPYVRVPRDGATPAVQSASFAPPALAPVYGFPANADGSGQTAAVIELGGGYDTADLTAYFQGLKLPVPKVTAVGVDGGKNVPGGDPTGADGEVLLDIEVLGALAPHANQVVYFGTNTDAAFVDAISQAVHATPTPTVVSISWGGPEDEWTPQSRAAMDAAFADAAALGVTVCVASGDTGSSDSEKDNKPHVDFPASSPHVLACGGTTLHLNPDGSVATETVWNHDGGACGGGVSDVFPVPSWQANAGVGDRVGTTNPGRGVPDVAAVADPATGYQVRVDGTDTVIGGTSAVAPLWSALVCRYAQLLNKKFGLLQDLIYDGVAAKRPQRGFRDITTGNNGAYQAGVGWDPCTGLGVPDADLGALLGGGSAG